MRPSNILDTFRNLLKSSASMYQISGSKFFRTTTEIQSDQMPLMNQASLWHFWHLLWHFVITIFGVMEILCSFRLALEVETIEEIPDSSRLEFLEKYWASNFALLDAEDNLSRSLNRGGKADLLLLRTLLAICQKYQEPSFWEMMN